MLNKERNMDLLTSKEKAEELVNKMYHEIVKDSTGKSIRCAIIAVDEVIDNILNFDPSIDYWKSVKQHLEEML